MPVANRYLSRARLMRLYRRGKDGCCECKPGGGGGGGGTGGTGGQGNGGNGGGKGNGNGVRPVPQGSWLVIRYDDSDHGARPVASGDAFWESPDIWFDGGDPLGNAIPGKPTPVHARIWNLGTLKAFPTRVDFAFVDPSLGISWSQPQLISQVPSWIGVPEMILGGGYAEVRCLKDWIPAKGSTHACLLVMCSCAISNDMPSQPWSPSTDRHVAQHNVNIAEADVGQMLTFDLHTINITPTPATVQLAAQVAWVDARTPRDALRFSSTGVANTLASLNQATDLGQMRLLAKRASRVLEGGAHVRGTALRGDDLHKVVRVSRIDSGGYARNGAIVIPSAGAVRGLNGYTPIGKEAPLKPLERRTASLEIKVPDRPGPARQLLVRLAQFENGFATGGYTVVVKVRN